MKAQQPDFIVLTEGNMSEIARELQAGNGIMLVADPKCYSSPSDLLSGEFYLHLFDKPTIDLKDKYLKVPRGTKKVGNENHQTGWENDREYRLHQRPRPQKQNREDDGLHRQLAGLYGQPSNLDQLYDQARDFFERLIVGEYEFEIRMENSCGFWIGRNKFTNWQAYFIPRSVSPGAALSHALTWMTDRWNNEKPLEGWPEHFKFTKEHIEQIVAYALEDLKTGAILRHNVQAGRDADAFVGLG